MTLVSSWIAEDQKKQSAVYIVTDSRISWEVKDASSGEIISILKWDLGRKIFHFKKYPDIICYCGDALFPTQVLSQAVDLFDSGLFYKAGSDFEERVSVFTEFVKNQFSNYPIETLKGFSILIAGRYNKNYNFGRFLLSWKEGKWDTKPMQDDGEHRLFNYSITLGTGRDFYKKYYEANYLKSDLHNFSRGAYTSFAHALMQDDLEERCGGAPQLVAIYNGGYPKIIGSVFNKKRYLLGCPVEESELLNNFEWRDETFQRIKGDKLELIENAQRQPGLKK